MKIKKIVKKFFIYTLLTLLAFIVILFVIHVGPSIWKNWVTYPKLEKERATLWSTYKKPQQYISLQEHKGVMHSHTFWSHDSRGTLPEILSAAKKAKLEFIFLADHKRNMLDDFPRGYHGVFDGIIMESGTESSTGLMVSPFDSVTLDWKKDEDQLINEVVGNGGLVTYVHTEDPHRWSNPDFQAMEIYNIHTDLLDEDGILPFVINNTVNGDKYRHWGYWELYDDQTEILANWDSLNLVRRIVGIGAVDAHNNQSFRARYQEDGLVQWIGPNADTIAVNKPGWKEKLLLGKPDEFGWSFKWEMDPYFNSFNFVNNHVFCDTFSSVNIKDNIIKGHVFLSFESLAEASGFQYFTTDNTNNITAILGDSVALEDVTYLKAVSPYPVKYQLFKNGELMDTKEDVYEYEFAINKSPGNYRIEARLKLNNHWYPWIFTNPIYVY
ncbi:MAG: hypothetical protein KAI99_01345 [Cyclobacteriaceae bacterium]|nr:hypothetical protein [Cyclobacteriaceae bacterium]